jgi:hypothetical protein
MMKLLFFSTFFAFILFLFLFCFVLILFLFLSVFFLIPDSPLVVNDELRSIHAANRASTDANQYQYTQVSIALQAKERQLQATEAHCREIDGFIEVDVYLVYLWA